MSRCGNTSQAVNRPGGSPHAGRKAVAESLWWVAYQLLFRLSPACCQVWRSWLLRLFGARVGRNVYVAPTVRIASPWNLRIDEGAQVLDRAVLECTAPVHIGSNVLIERCAQLCSGAESCVEVGIGPQPIRVEAGAVLGTDSFVGAGVTIGPGTFLHPRASAFSSLPGGVVADGSPARPVAEWKGLRGAIRPEDTSAASSGTAPDSPPPPPPAAHP